MFWKRRKTFSYRCSCCGEQVTGSPSFSVSAAHLFRHVPDEEFEDRVHVDDDLCHVRAVAGEVSDGDVFAIRASLAIPIRGADAPFNWSLWVTQSKENFLRYLEGVGSDQSSVTTFGWMPVVMSHYAKASLPVENLPCDVRWGEAGIRPTIFLHKSDHPLYRDQHDGITWTRAIEIAEPIMRAAHGQG